MFMVLPVYVIEKGESETKEGQMVGVQRVGVQR